MLIPISTSKLVVFKAYLDTDPTTEATGKTIAITISKNGGAFGNPNAGATNATEISSGWYKVTLDTTDTGTAGPLAVRGAHADINDVGVLYEVTSGIVANITQLLGNAIATPTVNGVLEVDLTHIGGSAVSTTTAQLGVNAVQISGSGTAADNAEIVYATDFATNYSTTTDKWQVEANVLQIEGVDATNQIRDSIVDDATRIDASALNTLSSHDPGETIMGATDLTAADIADAVWDEDATGHQTQGSFGQAIGDPAADTNTIYAAVVTNATGATVGHDTASILDDTGTSGVVVAAASKTGYTLSTAGLAAFFLTDSGETYADAVAGSVVAETANNAGSLTVQDIVDGLLDEASASHVAAGSVGEQISLIDSRASQTSVDDLPTNAELATALAAADDAVLAAIAALNNLSVAQVATEIADALGTDTYAEPTGVPPATATLAVKLGTLYMALRNGITITADAKTVLDDGGAAEWKKALSDDTVTYTEGEATTP